MKLPLVFKQIQYNKESFFNRSMHNLLLFFNNIPAHVIMSTKFKKWLHLLRVPLQSH